MKQIQAVEFSNFLRKKHCIYSTQFLWIGSVQEIRFDEWNIGTIYTIENLVTNANVNKTINL